MSVTGKAAGVRPLAYVETGKIITLGQHDSIVLGYLNSCTEETITGGTVKVGVDQSEVQSGLVARISSYSAGCRFPGSSFCRPGHR